MTRNVVEVKKPIALYAALVALAANAASADGRKDFARFVPDGTVIAWFERFRADDEEIYTNSICNAEATQWALESIPRFECPDRDIERTYYFRWWTYRKHLKKTKDGWVVTEFLPRVRWAGPENTISCPLNHHIMEGRWLRNGKYLDDYIAFMMHKGFVNGPRCYASAPAAAALERAKVTGDFDFVKSLENDFVHNCEVWEKGWNTKYSFFIGFRPERGLYDTFDSQEGTEMSLSRHGARPMVNSMRWADLKAVAQIARMAGDGNTANRFEAKAAVLEKTIKAKLWNREKKFFTTLAVDGNRPGEVCELHGYAPFYYDMPLGGYGEAWAKLMDAKTGFSAAPKGLTFPARDAPQFREIPLRSGCRWDGPCWPYATSIALTALYKTLQNGANEHVSSADFVKLLSQYAVQHRLVREDGKTVSWIDENLDAWTGEWLVRGILQEKSRSSGRPSDTPERGKDYNHSTFCDLVIAGLCGIRPSDDGRLAVKPLAPAAWDWWCIDGVLFHGRNVTVAFDRYGTHYGIGKGLVMFDAALGFDVSHANEPHNISKVYGGKAPRSSNDLKTPRMTFWPHLGTEEYISRSFDEARPRHSVEVFWFSDVSKGGKCDLPASWKVLFRESSEEPWHVCPVETPIKANEPSIAILPPGTIAKEVRLVVQLKENMSAGVLQWQVK